VSKVYYYCVIDVAVTPMDNKKSRSEIGKAWWQEKRHKLNDGSARLSSSRKRGSGYKS
jgi:hypothetical protein